MTLPELYSLAAGDSVVCGPKKAPGILRHFEDHLCEQARVEMANGKLKRWASSELRPARGPRVPAVRAVDPEDEGRPLAIVSLDSVIEARTGVHIERSVGSVRAPIVEQPKARPTRSDSFLAFVRQHPCCCCGQVLDIEAHHIVNGGMGKKASDRLTAPLTSEHHAFWHQHGHLPARDKIGSLGCMWEASARIQDAWEEQR